MNRIKNYLYNVVGKYQGIITPYIMLLLIPLALCLVLYAGVWHVTSNQIEELGAETAERFQASAAAAVQEIYYLSDTLCKDEGFLSLISGELTDGTASNYSTVCNRINNHIMRSKYVGQVKVFCEKQGSIYSPYCRYNYVSASSLLSTFSTELSVENLSQEEGWHILNPDYFWPYYVTNIYSSDGSEYLGTMVISIDTSAFLDIFVDVDADLVVLFNEDFYISSYIRNLPYADWLSEEWVGELLGEKVRCFYIEEDEFTYMVAISVTNYNKPLHLILMIFAAYYGLTLCFGIAYVFFISRRRYNSFMELIAELPQDPGKDMSYPEILSTIKTNIARDPVDAEMRARRLRYILRGYYDRQITDADLEQAGVKLAPYYRVVLFNMKSYKDVFSFDRSDSFADARRTIIEAAVNNYSGSQYSAVVTAIDLVFAAVYSMPSTDVAPDDFRGVVQNTLDLLEQKYGLNIVATVSSQISSADELHQAYEEAADIFSFIQASNRDLSVILQEDVSDGIGSVMGSSFSQELQMLVNALQFKKYSIIPAMTSALLKRHVQELDSHYYMATDRMRIVSGVLQESIINSDMNPQTVRSAVKKLNKGTSADELILAVNEVFGSAEYANSLDQPDNTEDIVDRACKFIEDNLYDCNLSVAQICEKMDISYPYLSRLFRKKLDSTVVEYINANRIARAKELLASSDATMSYIAEKVGYTNTVTFSRNFKHYVGITPSSYRELNT